MEARAIDRYRLLILLGVAIAARAATFGNPVVHVDEDFYFTVAQAMWRGALPYADVWDRKPIGLFLLYALPAALPFAWGIVAYQMMALVAVVGTAWMIARLATLAGWGRGATLAGVAYILWLNVAGGQGGQSPVFYNPLVAGAAWLIVGNAARLWWRDAAAMALVGVALQIKYSVLFEGLFFGLWIIARDWRAGKSAPRVLGGAAGLALVALLPTAAAAGRYAAMGQLDAFLFANFQSISLRGIDPPAEHWGNFGKLVLFLAPLLAMAVDSVRRQPGGPSARRFMLWWFGVVLGGIVVFGGWYDHYALPAFLPGTICTAGFLAARRRGRVVVLALVGLIGEVTVISNRIRYGGPGEFAALTAAIGDGPGCLWVYSGSPKIYAAVNRCRMTKFQFPSHLYRTREDGAIGVGQAAEVQRILRARPALIVMRPPSIGERPQIRAIVERAVARDYAVVARRPLGRETLTIYKRR
jgi:hypothetical protein